MHFYCFWEEPKKWLYCHEELAVCLCFNFPLVI